MAKSTMLERYLVYKEKFELDMEKAVPNTAQVWELQEVLYRIGVLSTCQLFIKTAPEGVDTKPLMVHYKALDSYIQHLSQERRFGEGKGGEVSPVRFSQREKRLRDAQKKRETAHDNFMRVIGDYRKRFSSFNPGGDAQKFRVEVERVIKAVIPAWIQLRSTYAPLKLIVVEGI